MLVKDYKEFMDVSLRVDNELYLSREESLIQIQIFEARKINNFRALRKIYKEMSKEVGDFFKQRISVKDHRYDILFDKFKKRRDKYFLIFQRLKDKYLDEVIFFDVMFNNKKQAITIVLRPLTYKKTIIMKIGNVSCASIKDEAFWRLNKGSAKKLELFIKRELMVALLYLHGEHFRGNKGTLKIPNI